jgi:acyl-CoA thioester hydrolase
MRYANDASYLNWVQAATLDHWQTFAPPTAVDAYLWVAVRHEITYWRPAFIADRLAANVKLSRVQRESAFYDILIKRGEEVLAEISSRWCAIDAVTRLPVRLPHGITDHFFNEMV